MMSAQADAIAPLGTGDKDATAAPRNQAMGKKITVFLRSQFLGTVGV